MRDLGPYPRHAGRLHGQFPNKFPTCVTLCPHFQQCLHFTPSPPSYSSPFPPISPNLPPTFPHSPPFFLWTHFPSGTLFNTL